jgi:hypothetical protein
MNPKGSILVAIGATYGGKCKRKPVRFEKWKTKISNKSIINYKSSLIKIC